MRIGEKQLRDMYVNGRQSLRACARMLDTDHHQIKRRLKQMGVRIRPKPEQVEAPTRRFVPAILKLHGEGLPGLQIARTLNVSPSTVCDRLKEQGIDKGWRHPGTVCLDKRTASEIARRYRRGESADAIGKAVSYSIHVVLKELKRRGVQIRSPHGGYRNRPDVWNAASQIARLYRAGLSTLSIAERFQCCDDLICRVLKNQRVKLRGTWKGGSTSFARRIRSMPQYWAWARSVRERFNHTCVVTGCRGRGLEVHHVKSLANLIDEFLQQHPELDPVRDVQRLVRLAREYRPFWQAEGVVLTRDVHRQRVHVAGSAWWDVDVAQAYSTLGSVRAVSRLLRISRDRVHRIISRIRPNRRHTG